MEERPHVLPPAKSEEEVKRLVQRYPIPIGDNGSPMKYDYGTAGFRYDASLLPSVMVRVGIVAALRSSFYNNEVVGVMITASHNDESYNGVKLADPNGGMMGPDGEALAVELANASTVESVWQIVQKHQDQQSLMQQSAPPNNKPVVYVGRDTRSHSPSLTQLVIRSAQAMGATVVSHGVVTTPQLHHVVVHANPKYLPLLIPPRPNVEGYYDLLCHSYHALLLTKNQQQQPQKATLPSSLVVDCACGVGYQPVQRLNRQLQQQLNVISKVCRPLVARNGPDDGPLNTQCGSEYVQKGICPPKFYDDLDNNNNNDKAIITYGASLDGDADRIVFFRQEKPNNFCLLDGDKIAVLICDFLQEQVSSLLEAIDTTTTTTKMSSSNETMPSWKNLRLGVVQTAYANGASTDYLRKLLGPDRVVIAKTGVKHVHTAAHDHFDIGVYFEANGHGTVLFGPQFYEFLARAEASGARGHVALQRLSLLPSLINQAVGDALSDLLLVDAILSLKGWDIERWNSLYQDLPSRQCKVKVEDRSMIRTNENETRCIEPPTLQPALDAAMKELRGSRCFVRPSGTENVVRVYAEASTPQEADALATKAAQLVRSLCRGVGDPPSFVSKM